MSITGETPNPGTSQDSIKTKELDFLSFMW